MKNSYTSKWILQRITALFLIPLTLWFIYQCISFQNLSYSEIIIFFKSIFNSFLFLALMILMLFHSKLGCETIVEDYISSNKNKFFIILLINLITYGLMMISIFSLLSIIL